MSYYTQKQESVPSEGQSRDLKGQRLPKCDREDEIWFCETQPHFSTTNLDMIASSSMDHPGANFHRSVTQPWGIAAPCEELEEAFEIAIRTMCKYITEWSNRAIQLYAIHSIHPSLPL